MAELRTAELFVVRLGAALGGAAVGAPRVHPDWRQGFRAAAIDGMGFHGFDTLFTIVAKRRAAQPRHPQPAPPERSAPRGAAAPAHRSLQTERLDEAATVLDEWLPGGGARGLAGGRGLRAKPRPEPALDPARPGLEAGSRCTSLPFSPIAASCWCNDECVESRSP